MRITEDGQRRRISETYDSEDQALDRRDRLRLAYRSERPTPSRPLPRDMSLVDFVVDVWWERYARKNLDEHTRYDYWLYFERLVVGSHLGDLPLTEIDGEDIVDWQDEALATATPQQVREAQKVISGAFKWAAIRRKRTGVQGNPVKTAGWTGQSRTRVVSLIDPELAECIRRIVLKRRASPLARQRDALMVSGIALTGGRPFELRNVQVRDIARSSIPLTLTKNKEPRPVELWKPLRDDIKARIKDAGLGPNDYVFGNVDGSQMDKDSYDNWRNRAWIPARDDVVEWLKKRDKDYKALEKARPYDLRHSYVALLLAAQRSLSEIADALGHQVDTCARIYAAVLPTYRGQTAIDPEAEVIKARAKRIRLA